MQKETLQALDIDALTEEEARVYGMEILRDTIDEDKVIAKRHGLISAVLTAAGIASTFLGGGPVSYGIWGADSFFCANAIQKAANIRLNAKHLKKFENGSYEESYRDFLKLCQGYSENQIKEEKGKTRW